MTSSALPASPYSVRRIAPPPCVAPRQRGFALLLGLIFLIMLSLIALVVMKGTLLEAHLTTATARHEQAFELSEAARQVPEALITQAVTLGDWPVALGGAIPNAQFGLSTILANRPAWISLLAPSGSSGMQFYCNTGKPINLAGLSPCSTQSPGYYYTPSQWSSTFIVNTAQGTATVSLIVDGNYTVAGNGLNCHNYAGVCGTATLLQISSQATVPGGGQATTIAQYQVRNP